MIYFEFFLTFIFLLGFASIALLQRNYLTNYMNTKGKNLADKEDIESITKLVETVKNDFNKNIEYLRSDLGVFESSKISLINEEKDAVVTFYKSYYEWYCALSMLSPEVSSYVTEKIEIAMDGLSEKYSEVIRYSAIFELFVSNGDLKKSKTELVIKTADKLAVDINNLFVKIIVNNIEKAKLENMMKDCVIVEDEMELQCKIKILIDDTKNISLAFINETAEKTKQLIVLQEEFQRSCKRHLYDLIKPDY